MVSISIGNPLTNNIFLQPSASNIPPKTLHELLTRFKQIDIENIDNSINENLWANKFCSYLQKRNEEDVHLFKFIIRIEAFQRNEQKIPKDSKAKSYRKNLYKNIVMSHFHEDSDTPVGLSNSALFDYLSEWSRETDKIVSDMDIEILLKSRNDPSVMSEGLDPSYKKFLSQTSPSALACLLSII